MKDLCLLFAVFLFVFRTIQFIDGSGVMLRKTLTKFGTFFILAVVVFVFIFHKNALFIGVLGILFSLLLFVAKEFLCVKREREFRDYFLFFLDRVVLLMRSGRAFHESLQVSVDEEKNMFFRKKIQNLVCFVVFSQQKDQCSRSSFAFKVALEMEKIGEIPHHQLENLLYLRRNLKIEGKIRHKSEQVLRQIRLQSVVLSILYFLLLCFLIFFQGFEENMGLIGMSLFLFSCGSFWIYRGGRGYRWKV